MARRFVVEHLRAGSLTLDERQAGHLRDVLRLPPGTMVELIDAAGQTAVAKVIRTNPSVELDVQSVESPLPGGPQLVIAAATPKGPRADWMVEKLSELGVDTLIPLEAARSVVHPESGKLQRWTRIADESAKQCKRRGIMKISPPTDVAQVVELEAKLKLCLSTGPDASPIASLLPLEGAILATVGPEGGWTPQELTMFSSRGFQMASLTRTILRIETAAIAVASITMATSNEKETR